MDRSIDHLAGPRLEGLRHIRTSCIVTFFIVISAIGLNDLVRFRALALAESHSMATAAANRLLDSGEAIGNAAQSVLLASDSARRDLARANLRQLLQKQGAQLSSQDGARKVLDDFLAAAKRVAADGTPLSAQDRLPLLGALEAARRDLRDAVRSHLKREVEQHEAILKQATLADIVIDGLIAVVLLALAFALFEPLLTGVAKQQTALDQALQSHSRLATIAQRTDNAVVIVDTEGCVEWVNRAFTQISGYTLEEMRGKNPSAILHRGDGNLPLMLRMRAAMNAGQGFGGTFMHYSKSGEPYWVTLDCQPMHDSAGRLTGFMSVESDVTNMRVRESTLERANLRFSLSTQAAGVGVWELDWDSKQMWWSETLFQILGAPAQAVASSWYKWISHIHPDDRERLQLAMESAAQSRELLRLQHRIVRPDGDIRHLEVTARVITNEDTHSALLIGTAVDVTERIAREQSERQLQLQLREASRMAGMAEVATGVLHNVGNVLNSVGVGVSTAQARVRQLRINQVDGTLATLLANRGDLQQFLSLQQNGRELAEYVPLLVRSLRADQAAILQELQGLDRFVDHLRHIVQMQQSYGQFAALIEPLDMREVLDAACTLLAPTHEQDEMPMQIVRRYDAVPLVESSRSKLLDVFCNLIKNAREAMIDTPDGQQVMELCVVPREDGVCVSVTDRGCGIAPDDLSRLWEFGFTTKRSGHGFGLHSVALTAQDLGGRVQVRSPGAGRGATFSIWLPRHHSTPETARAAA